MKVGVVLQSNVTKSDPPSFTTFTGGCLLSELTVQENVSPPVLLLGG